MLSIRTVPRLIRCLIISKNAEIKLLMFRAEFHCLYSYSVRIKFGKKGNIDYGKMHVNIYTVCPGSSYSNLYDELLYKLG